MKEKTNLNQDNFKETLCHKKGDGTEEGRNDKSCIVSFPRGYEKHTSTLRLFH